MSRIPITVRLPEPIAAAVDAARGGQTRTAWVEEAIYAALAEAKQAVPTASRKREAGDTCPPHPKGRVIKGFCYRCGSLVT